MGAGIILLISVRPLREAIRRVAAAVHPKLGRLAAGLLSGFEEFSFTRKAGFLLYGVVFQIRPLVVCYLLFTAFNPARMPSPQEFLTFGSVAVLMSNIPMTVAGIGPREAAIIALFRPYAPEATLLSVGVLMSFSVHVIPAILGIPFMFGLLKSIAAMAAETAPAPAGDAIPPAASVVEAAKE